MSTNISLTPVLEEYARSQVESGLYGSISEFMREAVRIHKERNLEHRLYLHQMHKELDQANKEIDKKQISPFNMKNIVKKSLK